MTDPERALRRAREEARRKREHGVYGPPEPGPLDDSVAPGRPDLELVGEWAVIAVDPSGVYSTRRAGAPITAVKRLLLRLLRQYHVELEAQQTRFNVALLRHVRELDQRVSALERASRE